MILVHAQAPQVPSPFVVSQILRRHGDVFAGRRSAAGQGEHGNLRVSKKSTQMAAAHLSDIGFEILIPRDGKVTAKVFAGADVGEMVVSAKIGVGLASEDGLT